jgi:transcription-repair coupling factor (superfamily II helicase)
MVLPFVRELLADMEHSEAFERVRRHLSAGTGRRRVSGLTATARALYLPFFVRAAAAPCVIIVADNKAAEALHTAVLSACELTGALPPEAVLRLPAHDVLPFENLSPHPEIQETRAATLWKIATGQARLVIAPVEAACMKLFSRDYYRALALHLKTGEEYMPDMLVEHLLSVGYAKVDVVEMPGQVTLRGGILDVYSPEMDRPVRIDFFGDEIESIRKFDPETQRSSSPLDHALLLPLTETPVTEKLLTAINARLTRAGTAGAVIEGGEEPAELLTHVSKRTGEYGVPGEPGRRGVEATVFPGWEFFAPVAGANLTLLDLLSASGLTPRVFIEEPAMVKNQGERWWNKIEQRHDRSGIGNLVRPEDIYLSPWDLDDRLHKFSGLELDQLGAVDILDADRSDLSEVDFATRPTQRFHGSIPALIDSLNALMKQDARVLLTAPNQGEVERLAGLLQEYHLPYRLGSRTEQPGSSTVYSESSYLAGDLRTPVIVKTPIAAGVQILDLDKATARQIVIFGAQDLIDDADVTARPIRRGKSKSSAFISDFRDLAVGDYVVHVEHGISRYCGLRVLEEDSAVPLELMILEFADEAKLYVPLTRLDLIQKYRSSDTGPAPELNKLGTQGWQKTKAKVKKAMADMAGELLKLYAQRKAAEGTPFSPDTNMQREFEDAFDFNETDDQLTAIADIKGDMESTQPMDRLLCGDVGYGKTEVAMRAAFKAVQDSKQVAVLTPTTVLSFQHYESFKKRFANFPVNVEMISRFRTPKEQKLILEEAEAGKIDILIGTHRVLSKDLKFQDLGLLIVDEEQRFGVRHKERLKQMRAAIDVLSMSATPIPRTLHMSLIGLRDMSVIETPPKDRMAIQTIVAKFDEKLIRTAIEMELERGGQTYFVHNRVETIYELAAKIRELVPQARIVIGHGQLPETELERVMLAFMNHEYDVLVATSIIENGLDIPLANTIIINRADRHGLSELYQLRGRVGRSNRRAYSYLLIPPETELTEIARRRLAALKEFSDLGAGFKIAALDLELRGAGNMLGGEQSGHIEAIGFEMYTTMLEEAVRKMKGEDDKPAYANTVINLGISVRIDSDYIPEENQRLRMYKRIAGAEDQTALADVRAELQDRYGTPPETVLNLLAAGEIRLLCEQRGISQLDRKRTQIELPNPNGNKKVPLKTFVEMLHIKFAAVNADPSHFADKSKATIDPAMLMKLVSRNAKRGAQFTPQGTLRWPLPSAKAEDVLSETRTLLESLNPAV